MKTQFSKSSSWPNFIPNEKLLADLARVAAKLQKRRISQTDYSDHGLYSFITICRRFGSWCEALGLVNCEPAKWKNVPAEKLLADLRRVAGNSPRLTANQYLAAGKYSLKTPYRLYGRWQLALAAAGLKPGNPRKLPPLPRGPRTINTALRYRVLLRDKFRCVACGRSPANDVNVKLEVDHIHPWSLGGSTRMENLRTLCSTCNKGKSDRVEPAASAPKMERQAPAPPADGPLIPPSAPASGQAEPRQSRGLMEPSEDQSAKPAAISPTDATASVPNG